MVSERGEDYYNIQAFADNGAVFLTDAATPSNSPMVLVPGATAPVLMADCGGAVIHPYCGQHILVSSTGDALFLGDIYQRSLYKLPATTTYPAAATLLCEMTTDMCCFNGDQALMPDGTLAARINDGSGGLYHLYFRKPGGTAWINAGLLPNEDNNHSVDIIATRTGKLYTWNIPLGATRDTGPVYRIGY